MMGIDTAIVGSAILLALIWPLYQQLEMRALRRSMRRMRDAQRQHARALVHLQTTMAGQPAQVHAPMNDRVWSGSMTAVAGAGRRASGEHLGWAELVKVPPRPPALVLDHDPDETLRLGPPPSLARIGELCHAAGLNPPRESLARIAAIEQHLAGGRPTTRMELARALGLQPWEISADLHTAILARIVTTTSGHHTAGEAAYTLPDPTIRMERMPLLPGAA